jgi:hypothetical protein
MKDEREEKKVDVIRFERSTVEANLNFFEDCFPTPVPEVSDVKEKSHYRGVFRVNKILFS